MLSHEPGTSGQEARPADLADASVAIVRRWLAAARMRRPTRAPSASPGCSATPRGWTSRSGSSTTWSGRRTCGSPGRNLERLSHAIPPLPALVHAGAIRIGGAVAPGLPWPVVPIAASGARRMVGHLVVDATPERSAGRCRSCAGRGIRLNINLLGEAVLGDGEAMRRLDGTRELLGRADVDYVSIKVSDVASQLLDVGLRRHGRHRGRAARAAVRVRRGIHDGEVHQPRHGGVPRSRPDDRGVPAAARAPRAREPRGGHRAAGVPPGRRRRARAAHRVGDRAAAPRRRGDQGAGRQGRQPRDGARRRHRCTTGRSPPTPPRSRPTRTTSACSRGRSPRAHRRRADRGRGPQPVRPRLRAAAREAAPRRARGSTSRCCSAWRPGRRRRSSATSAGCCCTRRSCSRSEFDSAISYLIRRLEENASPENFMSAVFELDEPSASSTREEQRFLDVARRARRQRCRAPNRRAAADSRRAEQLRERARHRPLDRGQPRVGLADARAQPRLAARARHARASPEVDRSERPGAAHPQHRDGRGRLGRAARRDARPHPARRRRRARARSAAG